MEKGNQIEAMAVELEELLKLGNEVNIHKYLTYIKNMVTSVEEKQYLKDRLEVIVKNLSVYQQILVFSFLIDLLEDINYAYRMIEIAKGTTLKPEEQYFIFNQIKSFIFMGKFQQQFEQKELYRLFQICVKNFKKNLGISKRIKKENRNSELVIVITRQFLNTSHAPTKTALGRCVALMKMGKKVLLINTAELNSLYGRVMFWKDVTGTYVSELNEEEYVEWENYKIPFFQCSNDMPNEDVLKLLLETIEQLCPYFVVEISCGSILASLVNDIVPVLSVGTVFSGISCSVTEYQTLGRKMNIEDEIYLRGIGRKKESIIEHQFTTELLKQTIKLQRADLGISNSEFVILVVGARLDVEMKDDFFEMLEVVTKKGDISIMVLGEFTLDEERKMKYPELVKRMYCLGMQKEVLAYIELCDLYVNPIRRGGGMSCVEAMSKGLPVITTDFGDVAVNAGTEFITENYDTMKNLIIKYKNEKDFYMMKSDKAKKRAVELTDTVNGFKEVIKEFCRREGLEI